MSSEQKMAKSVGPALPDVTTDCLRAASSGTAGPTKTSLVVGVGSPHGDDALGWHVVDHLRESRTWPEVIAFHKAEGGARLLDLLTDVQALIVIDALAPAGTPGKIERLEWPDARLAIERCCSTHHLSLSAAFELAATVDILPESVVVWGIEAASATPESGVSEQVRAALPVLTQAIIDELAAR